MGEEALEPPRVCTRASGCQWTGHRPQGRQKGRGRGRAVLLPAGPGGPVGREDTSMPTPPARNPLLRWPWPSASCPHLLCVKHEAASARGARQSPGWPAWTLALRGPQHGAGRQAASVRSDLQYTLRGEIRLLSFSYFNHTAAKKVIGHQSIWYSP